MITMSYTGLTIYAAASVIFIIYLFSRSNLLGTISRITYLCCVLWHAIFIAALASSMNYLPLASPPQAMNMTVFIATVVILPLVMKKSTMSLGAFYLPIATFLLNISLHAGALVHENMEGVSRYLYPLHTLSMTIGEALFVVASVVSIVYLVYERLIMKGTIHTRVSFLPSLNVLDRMLYATLAAGFTCITLGMLLGGFWAADIDIEMAVIAPKIAIGMIMWGVFALSLHQRFAIGWRGRKTAIITLVGVLLMVFLSLGIHLMLPGTHGIGIIK